MKAKEYLEKLEEAHRGRPWLNLGSRRTICGVDERGIVIRRNYAELDEGIALTLEEAEKVRDWLIQVLG